MSVFGSEVDWESLRSEWKVDDDGYIHLFNGENLDGWHIQGNPRGFGVEEGILRSEGGRGGNWMYWRPATFDDFELVVEWRVSSRGNSGVFIRVPAQGAPWRTGYEVQISNEQPPRNAHQCTGSLYDYAAVNPRPDETPEIWRTFVIRADGDRIQVKIDDETVVDYDQSQSDRTRNKPKQGFIGVQDSHAGEGSWVEFRTVKVRPLPR